MEIKIDEVIDNLKFTHIAKSQIHGNGLFASDNIVACTVLGELDGQIVPWELYCKYAMAMEWNALAEETLLVRPYRTKYSFINHSRKPNLILANNPLRVVVLADVKSGEELTLDYRSEPLPPEYIKYKGVFYL